MTTSSTHVDLHVDIELSIYMLLHKEVKENPYMQIWNDRDYLISLSCHPDAMKLGPNMKVLNNFYMRPNTTACQERKELDVPTFVDAGQSFAKNIKSNKLFSTGEHEDVSKGRIRTINLGKMTEKPMPFK